MRPKSFLPKVVAVTEAAAAPPTRMRGRQVRPAQVSQAVRMLPTMGMPIPPPMLVKAVTAELSQGVRRSSDRASAGLSRLARPASSTTLS
ncbi:hypothetical protein D9M72_576700 [compost metagenome]